MHPYNYTVDFEAGEEGRKNLQGVHVDMKGQMLTRFVRAQGFEMSSLTKLFR